MNHYLHYYRIGRSAGKSLYDLFSRVHLWIPILVDLILFRKSSALIALYTGFLKWNLCTYLKLMPWVSQPLLCLLWVSDPLQQRLCIFFCSVFYYCCNSGTSYSSWCALNLKSSWAVAFLMQSLHAWAVFFDSRFVGCFCFHFLYAAFFMLEFCHGFPVLPDWLPGTST